MSVYPGHPLFACARSAVVIALSIVLSSAAETRLYVDAQHGNDGNAGTDAKAPLRSIGKAVELVLPGSVVMIRPGTYDGRVVLARSGTPEAPIVFRRDGDGEVVWTMSPPDPKAWSEKFAFSLEGQSHVVIDGLTFRDCPAWLFMFDSQHVTVRNCIFDGSRIYNGIQLKNACHNRFINCRFVKAIPITTWKKMSDYWSKPEPAADYLEIYFNSHYNLVEGCEFGEIGHVAVSVSAFAPGHTPRGNVIRNCLFRDLIWKGIGMGAAEHTIIENNVFRGTAAMFIQLQAAKSIVRRNAFVGFREVPEAKAHDTLHSAIGLSSPNDRGTPTHAVSNRIVHNVFYDNDKCTSSFSWKGPIVDNVFKNNVFYRNKRTIFLPAPNYATTNKNRFLGNVLWGAHGGDVLLQLHGDFFSHREAVDKLGDSYGANIEADPAFVDAPGLNFALTATSPAIDKGLPLTEIVESLGGGEIVVRDPLFFTDGFGIIPGDGIQVGTNAPAKIVSVDYQSGRMRLDRPVVAAKGDPVSYPHSGKAPDIGMGEVEDPALADRMRSMLLGGRAVLP